MDKYLAGLAEIYWFQSGNSEYCGNQWKMTQRRTTHRHDGRNPKIMEPDRNLRVKRY